MSLNPASFARRLAICVAAISAAGVLNATVVTAAVPVPSNWRGTVNGKVYGEAFKLGVDVKLTRKLRGERNPFHLSVVTRGKQSANVGAETYVSAASYLTPYTARSVTLRYLRITVASTRISARLVDIHKPEAAVINGFTAPNVCLTVYSPFECVLTGPELFAFNKGATLTLRISGRRISGSLSGTGFGYTQILPYPAVRYDAHITASRR